LCKRIFGRIYHRVAAVDRAIRSNLFACGKKYFHYYPLRVGVSEEAAAEIKESA
jgi:hypothetical protein